MGTFFRRKDEERITRRKKWNHTKVQEVRGESDGRLGVLKINVLSGNCPVHKVICTLWDSDFLRMPLSPTLLPSRMDRNQDMTTGLPILKAHPGSSTTSSVGILGVQ